MSNETTTADGGVRKKGKLGQRIAYACGNLGQSAFYNAMSTYFIVYVTGCLFSGVDKALAAKLIGVITSLVVIIRIAEIFIDPLLGNLIDNTNTKWGRFRPWQFFGGLISAVLLAVIFSGMFGLVNVNTTLFIVLFVITFVVLDVFYSLRDISYWGMIPALSSDSHERSTYTSLGSFTGSIGYNGITIVVIPIVTYFSYMFTGKHAESQSGWTAFGIIVMLLGIIAVIVAVILNNGGFSEAIISLSQIPAEGSAMQGPFVSFFGPDLFNLLGVVVLTSLGTWGLPQMVQKFYAIKSGPAIKQGAIISTVFAMVVAGGSYFLGGFGRLYGDQVEMTAAGTPVYDSIMPTMLSTLPDLLIGIAQLWQVKLAANGRQGDLQLAHQRSLETLVILATFPTALLQLSEGRAQAAL